MLKRMLTATGLLLACAGNLSAGTLVVSSAGGRSFADSEGNVLPAGCAIRVGTFDLPPDTRDATLASTRDYSQLLAWFKPLAENASANSGSVQQANAGGNVLCTNDYPVSGETYGQITSFTTSYMPAGAQLYIWVFDGQDANSAHQWGIFSAGTWTAPSALGVSSLNTGGTVQALHGSAAAGQLRLTGIPNSYGNWAWKKFGLNAAPSLAAYDADTDGDGLRNLAEYAWGLDPASKNSSPTSLAANATGATFTFRNPLALPDVSVIAECSTDLTLWTPASSTVIETTADYEVRAVHSPPDTRCFWRVRFVSATP